MKNIIIIITTLLSFQFITAQEDVRYRVKIDASDLVYEKNMQEEVGKAQIRMELIGTEGAFVKGKVMEGRFRTISFTKEYIGDIIGINLSIGGVYWSRRIDIDEIEVAVSSDDWDDDKKYEFPCGCTLTQGNSKVSLDEGGALDFEADLAAIEEEDIRTNKIELDAEFSSAEVKGDGFYISKKPIKSAKVDPKIIKEDKQKYQICRTKEITASASFSESFLTNTSTTAIYPGALITAESMALGEYANIPAKRKPITLSTSIASVGSPVIEVENPKLSSIRAAMNELMKDKGEIEVQANFSIKEVHSREQLNIALGGHFSFGSGELNVDFNYDSETEQTLKVVKFAQIYYTIDMDQPDSPFDVFQYEKDALNVLNMDRTPLYISQVTYGRMAYFFMKTSMSVNEIKAHVDQAVQTAAADQSSYADLEKHSFLEEAETDVLIIGGDNTGITAVDDYAGFLDMLRDGGSFSAASVGVPISYVAKYLADNTVARVNLTSNYIKRECIPIEAENENLVIELEKIKMIDCADNDDDTELISYLFQVSLEDGKSKTSNSYLSGFKNSVFNVSKNNLDWNIGAGAERSIGESSKVFPYVVKELQNLTLKVTAAYTDYDDLGSNDYVLGSKTFRLADLISAQGNPGMSKIIEVEHNGDKAEFHFRVKSIK